MYKKLTNRIWYIVYKEDYSFNSQCRKIGMFEDYSLAKEYALRLKDKYAGQPICVYIRCLGNILFDIDCLDGEVRE